MTENDHEIWLLKNQPGELIASYQRLVSVIVHRYRKQGFISSRETGDLIQDINKILLERVERIQDQYNERSSLRTYFSVIVKNICREKFRRLNVLEEPQSPDYHKLEKSEPPVEALLVHQEYERFEKVLRLMFWDGIRFILIFRYIFNFKISRFHIINLNDSIDKAEVDKMNIFLNSNDAGGTKKAKFKMLSDALHVIEGEYTSPDSLRKWFSSRSKECIDLMNGKPPRSAYTIETLQILIEKYELLKKTE